MSYDRELEEILKKKAARLQEKAAESGAAAKAEEAEAQRRLILRAALTSEAYDRLYRVRLAHPQLAKLVEDYIINLYVSGALRRKITDEELKGLLAEIYEKYMHRETKIVFRRR